MRTLFLDDDPMRAAAFAQSRPDAVWVATAEECLLRLGEPWDEVYLDHDLGGEAYVDPGRDDCGMAVVRWLCEAPKEHLRGARFVVHTHNENAACIMALHLQVMGYRVEVRPFGRRGSASPHDAIASPRPVPSWRRLMDWLTGKAMPPMVPASAKDLGRGRGDGRPTRGG